jgi:hypothetical protein
VIINVASWATDDIMILLVISSKPDDFFHAGEVSAGNESFRTDTASHFSIC